MFYQWQLWLMLLWIHSCGLLSYKWVGPTAANNCLRRRSDSGVLLIFCCIQQICSLHLYLFELTTYIHTYYVWLRDFVFARTLRKNVIDIAFVCCLLAKRVVLISQSVSRGFMCFWVSGEHQPSPKTHLCNYFILFCLICFVLLESLLLPKIMPSQWSLLHV